MDKSIVENILYDLKLSGRSFSIEGGTIVAIPFDYKEKMPNCVELLSQWRIENPSLSPQRFPVSNERTDNWLKNNVINNNQRIMFMIKNKDDVSIGHIGLSQINFEKSEIRIDSIMRGVKGDTPGIIGKAISFLKCWCKKELGANVMDLVVLDDNDKEIRLYKKCCFTYEGIIPLRKDEENGEINWVEDYDLKNYEKSYIHMICQL